MVAGSAAITAAHVIMLLLGFPPLEMIWQNFLLVLLVLVGYLYYRLYRQTKESKGIIISSDQTFEEAHRDAVKEIEEE